MLSALVRLSEQAPFYVFTAFVFTYGTTLLGFSRDFVLVPVLVASALGFLLIPFFGYLSDRLGRKPVYMAGAAVTGVFGFVYFGMLDTRVAALAFVAIAISLVGHNMQYGWYILACAIVTLIAAALMRERARVDLAVEYGEHEAAPTPQLATSSSAR